MIDRRKLWKTVLTSWGFTLLGLFNLVIMLILTSLLAMRFAGPEGFVALIGPALAFMIVIFLGGEMIVNTVFRAHTPDPVLDKRFIDAVTSVRKKSRMLIRPRAYILSIGGKPNAMAYGPGLPFFAAVGVSREILELLDDEELEGVLCHEFAHIKCRDTGILAIVAFIIGLIDKLRVLLKARNGLLLQSTIGFVIGWVIYLIGKVAFYMSRFSISQERELAADALGAYYNKDPEPLIRALTKLHEWSARERAEKGEEKKHVLFEDLMVSHPGLDERIASLRGLLQTTVKEEQFA